MCLVIAVLMGIMALNFYLNGFVLQALITGIISLGFALLLGRNIRCAKGGCTQKFKKEEENDC